MEFTFAMLIIVGCILGAWAVIETRSNLFKERKLKETQGKLKEAQEKLKGMQEKQVATVDTPIVKKYSAVLTRKLIAEAIRANGYVPTITKTSVNFMIQGKTFSVITERLPMLTLYKGYKLDKSNYDMDLLRQACHQVSDDMFMVKAYINDDEETISFDVTTVEQCFGNFCASLSYSINFINNAVVSCFAIYKELKEAQVRRDSTSSLQEKTTD